MKMNLFRAAIVATSLTLGAALPTHAALLTWTLSGVQFSDGTTAIGSIIMDPTARTSGSFSVSTFDGILMQKTYDNSNSGLYFGGGAGPNNFILFDTNVQRYFNFSFVNALAPLGGDFALNTANSYECMNCSPFRFVTAGSLTTLAAADIPEPGTVALLLPALGMMGWMARRRKQQAAR
jgi:hypothetical protein